ncbi:MAG: RluA family pseudouridine synthase [Oscillospiraceae bacterium]|nr:RluA family pseudouridine synthase [Oscillospiraceae bacterium]
MREILYTVPQDMDGCTAAVFLRASGYSRRMMSNLKATGGLTRGGEILRTVDIVRCGDIISVVMEDEPTMTPNPSLKAELSYSDEDIAVFSKPPDMPVHPSIKHPDDTLGNLFTAMFPDTVFRPVYRLDCNTSGLCVCAKTRHAAAVLAKSIDKVYYAVVKGDMGSGEIDLPIGREEGSIIRREISADGKPAKTLYYTERFENGHSLVRVRLLTGRTHQIRVHFSHMGFPLCGDDLYGGDRTMISRHALHCGEVSFTHPVTGKRITVTSQLPEDMTALFRTEVK